MICAHPLQSLRCDCIKRTPLHRIGSTRGRTMVAAASADKLTFYDSGSCPYAQRVWLALEEKGLPYETVRVDLANRSEEFTDLYRSVSLDEHLGKVPVLVDGNKTLIESGPIVEYLENRFPDHGQRLLPEDPLQRYRVKLWADVFTDKLAVFPILRATTKAEVAEGEKKLTAGLKYLENFLQKYAGAGEPGYFLGEKYSFAETITTPFIRRYLLALPKYRSIDISSIIEAEGLMRLQKWIKAALDRPSNKETGPSDEHVVAGFGRFVSPLSDAAEA